LRNLKSTRALVIASEMATMAMIAIEATIVSTAMPQIVADLGGLRLYSWVFSSFLLAQTATTVLGNIDQYRVDAAMTECHSCSRFPVP